MDKAGQRGPVVREPSALNKCSTPKNWDSRRRFRKSLFRTVGWTNTGLDRRIPGNGCCINCSFHARFFSNMENHGMEVLAAPHKGGLLPIFSAVVFHICTNTHDGGAGNFHRPKGYEYIFIYIYIYMFFFGSRRFGSSWACLGRFSVFLRNGAPTRAKHSFLQCSAQIYLNLAGA